MRQRRFQERPGKGLSLFKGSSQSNLTVIEGDYGLTRHDMEAAKILKKERKFYQQFMDLPPEASEDEVLSVSRPWEGCTRQIVGCASSLLAYAIMEGFSRSPESRERMIGAFLARKYVELKKLPPSFGAHVLHRLVQDPFSEVSAQASEQLTKLAQTLGQPQDDLLAHCLTSTVYNDAVYRPEFLIPSSPEAAPRPRPELTLLRGGLAE